jgi:hypothetical protein
MAGDPHPLTQWTAGNVVSASTDPHLLIQRLVVEYIYRGIPHGRCYDLHLPTFDLPVVKPSRHWEYRLSAEPDPDPWYGRC